MRPYPFLPLPLLFFWKRVMFVHVVLVGDVGGVCENVVVRESKKG